MTMFLVRDDDTNATTSPERIERAYAPLLDAGIPICFAVIPEVALDTRDPDGARERFLDEASPDSNVHMRLTADSPFARWLRARGKAVDVFQHGLTHRRLREGTEFGALRRDEAKERIVLGSSILTRALGRTPLGFVAPWDVLSTGALRACTDHFGLLSTGWVDRHVLPLTAWPAHVLERVQRREALRVGRSWIVRHRGGKLGKDTAADEVPRAMSALSQGADVAVVVLHHWMYWNGDGPHPAIVALARVLRDRRVGDIRAALEVLDARPLWQGAAPSFTHTAA